MNTDGHGSLRVFAIAAAIAGAQAAHSGGGEPPEYEVEVIPGPFCGMFGYEPAVGLGINDLGNICGFHFDCNNDDQPFFWSPKTGRVELEIPAGFDEGRAYDLNSKDQVVGQLRMNNVPHAMLWQNGEVIELGIPPGGNFSEALAINSQAQIVGNWGNSAVGPIHGFLWQDGVIRNLGDDLGTLTSRANDLNEKTQVTGWMGSSIFTDATAFIWDDGKITDLGVIPGGITGMGMAINNQGDVAVQGLTFNDNKELIIRSFVWREGQWIDLGVLPGFEETLALDLNDAGQVIGRCELLDTNNTDPFLWEDGVMWNLNDLWVSEDPGFDGISKVWGISDEGGITGSAPHDEFSGVAIRLTPIGVSLGDLDGDGVVGASDLLILLSSWGQCDDCENCPADLDDNCIVGASDLLILLLNWG